jgi:hypothetical protein
MRRSLAGSLAASLFASLALAACAPAPAAPVAARPLAHESAAPAACLPAAFRDAALAGLTAEGDRAKLCLEVRSETGAEPAEHACLLLDATARAVGTAAWVPPHFADGPEEHTLAPAGQGYTVCARRTRRCTRFQVGRPLHEYLKAAGTVSADGTLAFVLHDRKAPASAWSHEIVGELYEVQTGRLLGQVPLTSALELGDTSITRAVGFSGRRVIVGSFPAGPGGVTAIADPATGKGIALHGFGGDHVELDANTMLALDEHRLSIIGLEAMTVTRRLAVPGAPFDNPEQSSMWMTRLGGAVLVAYAQPAGALAFDVATRRLSPPHPLPICRS